MTDTANRQWCWPFRHDWAKWHDTERVQKEVERNGKMLVQNTGVVQERRCQRCGQVQLHTEWET